MSLKKIFLIVCLLLVAAVIYLQPAYIPILLGGLAFGLTIDRSGVAPLIPEDVLKEIIQGVPEQSACLSLFKRLPNMQTNQQRMPVLSLLPTAYFVNGDAGLKQTTKTAWENKYLNAEELAVFVPIPESVLSDSAYPIWDEVKPRILEALGVAIDAAIIHGINAPASWPTNIIDAALSAGNVVALGTGDDIYDDIMGEAGVLSLVEQDGFMVTGHIAAMTMKGKLRGLRSATEKLPLFVRTMQDKTPYQLDGEPMYFPRNGAVDPDVALLISGDFQNAVYSIRQDVTTKIFSEATLYDTNGTTILYRLAQQDMIALRVVMRLAWEVPNPINRMQQTKANRYPFGVLSTVALSESS